MKKINVKKITPYLVAIVTFLLFSLAYCYPLLNGKVLNASDRNLYKGGVHEMEEFAESEGRTIWWTDSMFGGMPTYQIGGMMPSGKISLTMNKIAHFWFSEDARACGMILTYLAGFFLMMLCFGVSPWLSIAGAFALALSSYFLLIIPSGHMTKADAIGVLAPMIGGCYAILKGRYKLGIPLVLLCGITGITLHPQMTYYIGMFIGVIVLGEIISKLIKKEYRTLGISCGILFVAMLLVFGTKASWIQMNGSYQKDTIRGGASELEADTTSASGLEYDYATAYSYGIKETFTLLIPEFMGGKTGYNLGKNSTLEKELKEKGAVYKDIKSICKSAPTYWGEKPFTNGPVYVGAIVCFLFILGIMIVPGTIKWTLLISTVLSITLAWGHNLEFLSRLFFDYFPLFNKFRAIESILVVAEIAMPLLGILSIKQLMQTDKIQKYRKPILASGGITALICIVIAIAGNSMNVTCSSDAALLNNERFYQALISQRHAMIVSSALRSLIFVIIGAGIVYLYTFIQNANNSNIILPALLTAAIVIDMAPVDSHFFGKDDFISKKKSKDIFAIQRWENAVLQDGNQGRVLKLSNKTYKESRTSYRCKSVGGYSAVKSRRYQDIITNHLLKNNISALKLLNVKYIVESDKEMTIMNDNPGEAWFVDDIQFVDTPQQESDALWNIDVNTQAVADREFENILSVPHTPDSEYNRIHLDKYVPDHLEYSAFCMTPKLAVFSEIYYPEDWHLYIDGVEHPIGRVNYILRGAVIPQGDHKIVMEFKPSALKTDVICLILTILALVISVACIAVPKSLICKSVHE